MNHRAPSAPLRPRGPGMNTNQKGTPVNHTTPSARWLTRRPRVLGGGPGQAASRTQDAALGGAKGKSEDAEMRSVPGTSSGRARSAGQRSLTPSLRSGLSVALRGVIGGGGGSGASCEGVGGGRTSAIRAVGLAAVVAAVSLALTAPSALAIEKHTLAESFGAGQLDLQAGNVTQAGSAQPSPGSGLAVNQTSHDVYVADTSNHRVAQFEADGTFVRGFASLAEPTFIAVDNSGGSSQGDVYVADSASGSVSKFEADGTPVTTWASSGVLSGFSALKGIAVGPGGDLFVVSEANTVNRYEADGTPVGSAFEAPAGTLPAGIAADAEANLYKVGGNGQVSKFGPAGENLAETLDARTDAIALGVDPSSNDLYVVQSNEGTPFVNRFGVNCGEACPELESFGSGEVLSPQGIAIDAATHTAYVTDAATSTVDVFRLADVPEVSATTVTENLGVSAVVHGEVNPDGIALTDCAFEYVTQAAYEQTGFSDLVSGGSAACEAPDAGEIPVDETFHAVHAQLGGLTPNTTYRFRLRAANAQGANRSPSLPLLTAGPPAVDLTSVSEVTATTATLETELNPHGLATTYHFEYDTVPYTEGGPAHGTPTPTGSAGSGTVDVLRSAQIAGLTPSTTYHFRVVAENSLGTATGPDRAFTTQPATSASLLPDGRAWELVSPPDKHGTPLTPISGALGVGGVIEAAADGSALTYIAHGSILSQASGNRSPNESQLLAHRGVGGWATEDITTANESPAGAVPGNTSEYKFFSPELARAALEPFGTTPLSPLTSTKTPYLREANGTYTPLVYPGNVPSGTKFGENGTNGVLFVTATPDLSHALLKSKAPLVQGFDNGGNEAIYEWSDGTLTPVSILPDGAPSGEEGQANVGVNDFQVRNAISADGDRVFFETTAHQRLYLRDIALGQTLRVDAAAPGVEPSEGGAVFQLATPDGSRVFFTDPQRLTADSTADGERQDLYMCQVEETSAGLACSLTDLSANSANPSEPAAVQNVVLGAAADGSSVYFVAHGALTTAPDPGGEVPRPGQPNLYRVDTNTGAVTLVAVLSEEDEHDWFADSGFNLGTVTSRVSPDGNWLAFMSQRPLTGYDNRDAVSGERDEEVFLYDAAANGGEGKLICASCNPSGARPLGRRLPGALEFPSPLIDTTKNWASRWLAASIPGWTLKDGSSALYQSRYLSNSGRLFFNATDALVPADSNGTGDVYSYEPAGVGTCTTGGSDYSSTNGGCVDLISSGTSGQESAFLDASENGDDVFFLTASRLTPRDVDGAYDVYDARVGGGEPEPVKPVECSGDACQAPAVPPNDATPGSLTFDGAGNVVQCPKGKVKKSGKCVKRKKSKHPKKHKHPKAHKRSKPKAGH